ncbi:MAG: NosD domain-containing protein [Halobacteriota archaeon]
MRTNKELVSIVLRAILVISLFAWIIGVASAATYNETNRYIEGTNVSVNTTGAFNRSYNVTAIPLWFQINNTLNTTATYFNVTNQTGLTTNGTSGMSNVSWFWVNANSADTYWVNVSSVANASEYVNFTVVYYDKGAWNDTGNKTHDANESFWENIQDAINNTGPGSTIVVHNGTYNENVLVDRKLTIQSESGYASAIVNASAADNYVFAIFANYVNISGFTVQNATASGDIGIYLGGGIEHCNISNNNVTNNDIGIFLNSSSNNTLTSNTANSNNCSIILYNSSYNTLTSNTANLNNQDGILLNFSSNNTLTSNNASDNQHGIFLLNSSSNNTLTSNTANSNIVGIYLLNSNNSNTLTDNTANLNSIVGIFLNFSSNNTLTSNTANSNSDLGIFLNFSSNNTLTDNIASDNTNLSFYSDENSHNNTVEDLTISSSTTISFTYGQGIMIRGGTNPNSDPSGKENIGKFVNATNVTANSWLFLNVSYTDANISGIIELTLKMYNWSGTAWGVVSGVNDVNEAGNYVYANITSFSQIAPFGDPKPTPTPAPVVRRGGGGAAAPSVGAGETTVSTEPTGEVKTSVTAPSADGKAVVTIYEETIAKDAAGSPLTSVTVTQPSALPAGAPSGANYVGYAYNFGPEGATFSKPVTISITFDTAKFEGKTPVIHVSEAGAWKALATTVVGNKATATVTHFSTFVLFAAEEVITPTPTATPTPKPTPTATPSPTPTPTPEGPGFEAVFAIAGLLAVAYLVLRRKKRK